VICPVLEYFPVCADDCMYLVEFPDVVAVFLVVEVEVEVEVELSVDPDALS
jgi:hypothetical protein